ncbi:hypothetical protein [Alkalihalobacillus trypoxylicola]|uniref:HIG1 domain-containing protein n=1 Tax=Alkalihalobacillus trypoxylicola TaxID=519424 RepID=A0A161PJ35_9BACI|nr:hypothetical protein [Alkalihalobacillus trypoxylicola]KYG33341.1 hypothetical protein AZF04_16635 [Alkalihalobacillus trypoxylicola]
MYFISSVLSLIFLAVAGVLILQLVISTRKIKRGGPISEELATKSRKRLKYIRTLLLYGIVLSIMAIYFSP